MAKHLYRICILSLTCLVSYPAFAFKKNYANSTLNILARDYSHLNAWGLHTTIDLKNCDPELIRSSDAIREYTIEVCKLLKVNRYGEPQIVHFGREKHVEGFSLVQFIETSLVSGHFANITNSAYIDIFSCKMYDPFLVTEFTKNFFKAETYNNNVFLRI